MTRACQIALILLQIARAIVTQRTTCAGGCVCTRSDADCADRRLRVVPSNWPALLVTINLKNNRIRTVQRSFANRKVSSVRILAMSSNKIKRISNEDFTGLTNLEELMLDFNQISQIEERAFDSLLELDSIDLSNNQLCSLNAAWFANLRKLRKVVLDNNRLRTVPGKFFDRVSRPVLQLASNPWTCDCRLLGMLIWLRDKNKPVGAAVTCSGPPALSGRDLHSFKYEDFEKVCAKNGLPTSSNDECEEKTTSCAAHTSKSAVDICYISVPVQSQIGDHLCLHCVTTNDQNKLLDENIEDEKKAWKIPSEEAMEGVAVYPNGTLCIDGLKAQHGGEYVCTAEFSNHTSERSVFVNVENLPLKMLWMSGVGFSVAALIAALCLLRWWRKELAYARDDA